MVPRSVILLFHPKKDMVQNNCWNVSSSSYDLATSGSGMRWGHRSFGRTHCLYLQGSRVWQATSKQICLLLGCLDNCSILKTDVVCSSETSVLDGVHLVVSGVRTSKAVLLEDKAIPEGGISQLQSAIRVIFGESGGNRPHMTHAGGCCWVGCGAGMRSVQHPAL
jgi:hypothetical protein